MKFNPTTIQKWTITLLLIAAGVAVLLSGIFARHTVLKANPCQMTYSKREKTEIPLCGSKCDYKLWKITNPFNKKLNPQPVLYIPGHFGSANQARSFASHMHNEDDHFQYFTMDFTQGSSALHGSDVFAQAHATNRALAVIQGLYAKKKGHAIGLEADAVRKIALVGHSMGGVVARVAPLLSNHPACAVRDILLLSSPNTRPSYTPDASLDAAFQLVNQFWTSAYRNSTALPELCAHLGPYASAATDSNDTSVSGARNSVVVGFACPTCLTSMRLVSVTGGEVDLEVPAYLTDLNTLFPAPAVNKKVVMHSSGSAGTDSMVFSAAKSVFNFSVRQVLNVLGYGKPDNGTAGAGNSTSSAHATSVSGADNVVVVDVPSVVTDTVVAGGEVDTTTSTVLEAEVEVDASADVTVANLSPTVSDPDTTPADTTSSTPATPITISTPVFTPQAAPSLQFVSLRASQLRSVGFPVDHAAVVWCFDLLHVLTTGLRTLSTTGVGGSVEWNDIFPVVGYNTTHASNNGTVSVDSLVYHLNTRRQYAKLWMEAAQKEHSYITTALPYAYLTTLPFVFVTSHLLKIAVCYLLVSLLVLAAPLLRILTGNNTNATSTATNFDNILPWNHLSLDIVYAGVFSALRTSAPPPLLPHLFTVLYQLVLILLTIKALYEYFMGTFLLSSYVGVLYWTAAYVLSLLLRAVLLCLLQVVQGSSAGVYSVVRAVLRYTVWNQTIRRAVRGVLKTVDSKLSRLPFYPTLSNVAMLAVAAAWSAVFVTAHKLDNRVTYGLSVLVVVVYALLCTGVLASLLLPTTTNKKASAAHTYYNTDLLLLYLPAPLLAFPTFYSAYRMLYTHSAYSEVSLLYSALDTGRVWYILAVGAVSAHVWLARNPSSLPSRAVPLRFLFEGLGPHALQAYTDLFGSTHTSSGDNSGAGSSGGVDTSMLNTGVNSGKNGCVHEDGGKLAIFEQISHDEQGDEKRTVAHNVTLGSTYKVVSCNCARDPSLSEVVEWCSWCKCRQCGGKHLPAASKMRFNAHFSGANVSEMHDFSVDLLPLVVLSVVAVVSVYAVLDAPYVYLYALGVVAVAFVVRELSLGAHK